MDRQRQVRLAERFRALHDRRQVLLLPNAWDAGSARVFDRLGFAAIATTSGGMAWSLGHADGERMPLAEVVEAARRIVRATTRPVSVDFEAGYGDTPAEVAASVRAIVDAGVAGINLEDGIAHARLRTPDEAARRIAAAREAAGAAGVPVFINARVDCWLVETAASAADRRAETIRRARAYLAAGADGIYPIGVAGRDDIAALVQAIDAPVNVGARPGLPNLAELGRLGVARVSTATRLAALALSSVRAAATALRERGDFDVLDAPFGYDDAQRLFESS